MYDQLRNDVVTNCVSMGMSTETIQSVLIALDRASERYEITTKTMDLAVIDKDVVPPIVQSFIACKIVAGQSKGTIKNYLSLLTNFFQYVRKAPGEVDANDIRVFLMNYKEKEQVQDNTLDKYRNYINAFYEWACEEDYLTKNPAKKVAKIKFEQKPREALNQIELEYLRQACKTERETCVLEVLYSTGCRAAELVGIKLDDIDFNMKTVHLFGKGKKHRTAYLNAKAIVAIQAYLQVRQGDSEYLLVSDYAPHNKINVGTVERIMKVISSAGNVHKKVSPHIIRHTTATTALSNGMPINSISQLLGHSNVTTTMIYAHQNQNEIQAQHGKYVI